MATVRVKDEIYRRLAARAANQHTTVENLVEAVLENLAGAEPQAGQGSSPAIQDRLRALEEWMEIVRERASRYPQDFVVDDSRESIYAGRGE